MTRGRGSEILATEGPGNKEKGVFVFAESIVKFVQYFAVVKNYCRIINKHLRVHFIQFNDNL